VKRSVRPGRSGRADPLGRPPALLMVPATVAVLMLLVPLGALVIGTDLTDLWRQLGTDLLREALWLSVLTSTLAMLLCLLLGLPLAWLLARVSFRGRGIVRALVTVPLVLPPVVAGIALREAFGRTGLLGAPLLEQTGFSFPYTTYGVVLAHTFVSLPFVVIAIEGALRSVDTRVEQAAATLGASRWLTFRRVTAPLVLPGIAAGMVLGWARSLGEFGATITFNGNYPGTTQTMPTLIYVTRQSDRPAALALSLVMLAFSIGILLLLRERWLGPVGASA